MITVEQLCEALEFYLKNGGSPKNGVKTEGCDCIGACSGISWDERHLFINRASPSLEEARPTFLTKSDGV